MLLRGEGGLPPSPPVPEPVQAALVRKRPLEFLDWCRDRCGDRFTPYTLPWGDTFHTAVPDDIGSIFTGDQTHIHAGEAFEKAFARVMGPNALFVIDERTTCACGA